MCRVWDSVWRVHYSWLAYPVAGVINGVGDVVAQELIEGSGLRDHDWKRTFRYSFIGFVFVVGKSYA